jgi:peroxiredoxin
LRAAGASARARSLVGLLATVCALAAGPAGPLADKAPPRAPRFSIRDLEGHTLSLEQILRRGPVVLDFWATWCQPCVESLSEFEALHRTYGPRGLTVIGVSVDGPRNHARVRPFVASRGLTYPIALDQDGRLQQLYQVLAIPTAFLIDTSGAIVRVRVAFRPGEAASLEAAIQTLLPDHPEP